MSKNYLTIGTAQTLCVALLLVAAPMATHELHLGCKHDHQSSCHDEGPQNAWHSHSCVCAHRAAGHDSESESSSNAPHDSDSCPICRAGFAVAVASFNIRPVSEIGVVVWLCERECGVPDHAPQYRDLSRGPPV